VRQPSSSAFFLQEVGILPVWICPIGGYDPQAKFRSISRSPDLVRELRFWDVVQDPVRREPGHYNRKIERKVRGARRSEIVYSDSYYPEEEFWRLYNKPRTTRSSALRPKGKVPEPLREVRVAAVGRQSRRTGPTTDGADEIAFLRVIVEPRPPFKSS